MLQRSEGRHLFGLDASGYAAGRPDYPERVYTALGQRCGLGPGARVLEIGPGTGLVTGHLVSAGARVTAVEPDPGLAAHLRAQCPDVEVVAATLEDARLDEGGFDLAVAATSWHWVDQPVGLAKLGAGLRSGGWAAIWWTLFRDPARPDPFAGAVEEILGPGTRGAFDEPGRPPFQLDQEHRTRDLQQGAGLVEVEADLLHWRWSASPAQVRALYASMATVLRRPPAEQLELLGAIEGLAAEAFGGRVERRFVTALYTGRKP